jgi:hypothetical protein
VDSQYLLPLVVGACLLNNLGAEMIPGSPKRRSQEVVILDQSHYISRGLSCYIYRYGRPSAPKVVRYKSVSNEKDSNEKSEKYSDEKSEKREPQEHDDSHNVQQTAIKSKN